MQWFILKKLKTDVKKSHVLRKAGSPPRWNSLEIDAFLSDAFVCNCSKNTKSFIIYI